MQTVGPIFWPAEQTSRQKLPVTPAELLEAYKLHGSSGQTLRMFLIQASLHLLSRVGILQKLHQLRDILLFYTIIIVITLPAADRL